MNSMMEELTLYTIVLNVNKLRFRIATRPMVCKKINNYSLSNFKKSINKNQLNNWFMKIALNTDVILYQRSGSTITNVSCIKPYV